MADSAYYDLPYGHFGTARFNTEDNEWHFARISEPPRLPHLLGSRRIWVEPAKAAEAETLIPEHIDSREGQRLIRSLARSYPDLQAASDLVKPFLDVSKAVQLAKGSDAARGCLLGFSSIRSHAKHRQTAFVAFASGISGSAVCFAELVTQRRCWTDRSQFLDIHVPHGNKTLWSADASPVCQILLSQPTSRGDVLIAIRKPTLTTILRARHINVSSDARHDARISPEVMFSLSAVDTGGDQHMDVQFNPWFPQQVALVDFSGRLTVVQFSSNRMNNVDTTWRYDKPRKASGNVNALDDGWARVHWVVNVKTLLICSRTTIRLLSVEESGLSFIKKLEVPLPEMLPWILDFHIPPSQMDYFCILTPEFILIYHAVPDGEDISVTTEASIRHFKNPNDVTLRLTSWSDQKVVVICLRSELNFLVSEYRLHLTSSGMIKVEEPVGYDLALPADYVNNQPHILDLTARPVTATLPTREHDQGEVSDDARPRFSTLVTLTSDFSVVENLLYFARKGPDVRSLSPPNIDGNLRRARGKRENDTFELKVYDSASSDGDHDEFAHYEPMPRNMRRPPAPSNRVRPMDLASIARRMNDLGMDARPIGDVVEDSQRLLEKVDVLGHSMIGSTLSELAGREVIVDDVDRVSTVLETLPLSRSRLLESNDDPYEPIEETVQLALKRITLPPSLNPYLPQPEANLSEIYHQLVSTWVTPLPENIHARFRLAKAHLARRISAGILFSSYRFQLEHVPTDSLPPMTQTEPSDTTKFELPLRGGADPQSTGTSRLQTLREAASTQSSLPTPSPSGTPSITTLASSSLSTLATPEITRLRKYVTFENPNLALTTHPRAIRKILAHWPLQDNELHSNLDEYDWLATSRLIAQRNDDEDEAAAHSNLTEREQRRIQKRIRRHIHRQRREAAASEAQYLASSQVPDILGAGAHSSQVRDSSQPPHAPALPTIAHTQPSSSQSAYTLPPALSQRKRAVADSSQTAAGQSHLIASQTAPGRYGTRVSHTPAKKKKRKLGF